jgi:hypothetical protein
MLSETCPAVSRMAVSTFLGLAHVRIDNAAGLLPDVGDHPHGNRDAIMRPDQEPLVSLRLVRQHPLGIAGHRLDGVRDLSPVPPRRERAWVAGLVKT